MSLNLAKIKQGDGHGIGEPSMAIVLCNKCALHAHPIDLDCSLAVSPPFSQMCGRKGGPHAPAGTPSCKQKKTKNTLAKAASVLAFPTLNKAMGMESGSPVGERLPASMARHMFASVKASLGVANDWVSLEFLQVIISVLPARLYHARY
jgi:hypothetical protein